MSKIDVLEEEKKYWNEQTFLTKQISTNLAKEVDQVVTCALKRLKDLTESGVNQDDIHPNTGL